MLLRHAVTATALLSLGLAGQSSDAQNAADHSVIAARLTLAPVYDAHDRLATRFRSLWGDATAVRATVHDRVSFLRFLNAELLTQLDREGAVLYSVFDSLTAGSYATTAALLDRQAIGRLVKQLGDTAACLLPRPPRASRLRPSGQLPRHAPATSRVIT